MSVNKETIRQVMSFLGSQKSKRKTESCRENARKPRPNARKNRKKHTKMKTTSVVALLVAFWLIGSAVLIYRGEQAERRGAEQKPSIEIVP